MTADEVLAMCESAKCKAQSAMCRRIGIPREASVGGPIMRAVAEAYAANGRDSYLALREPVLRSLEIELGRAICNSGDILFGEILICMWLDDDERDPEQGVLVEYP